MPRAVDEQGYRTVTPIHQQAIPLIFEGRDVLAGAQTGTGKTVGFTLPMLQRLQHGTVNRRRVRALVLTATWEPAAQIAENVRCYGQYLLFGIALALNIGNSFASKYQEIPHTVWLELRGYGQADHNEAGEAIFTQKEVQVEPNSSASSKGRNSGKRRSLVRQA